MLAVTAMRFMRAIVLFMCGFFTTFTLHGFFTPVASLHVLGVIFPLVVFGIIMMLGGIAILWYRWRVIGYFIGIVAFGALCITAAVALFIPGPHSPLVFTFPLMCGVYFEGLAGVIKDRFS